jgi:hypothetical protein
VKFLALFMLFGCKYLLLSGLVFYSRLLSESLEAFFELGFSHGHLKGCFCSGLYYLDIRVMIPYPSKYILRASRASMLHKQRVSILRFAVFGQAPTLFELWILIPRIAFWLAMPY